MNHQFEIPLSIPEIMQKFYKNDLTDLYNRIMKTPNQKQQDLLNTKYRPYIFDNFRQVPDSYPTFALRNVYLKTWIENDPNNRNYNCLDDKNLLFKEREYKKTEKYNWTAPHKSKRHNSCKKKKNLGNHSKHGCSLWCHSGLVTKMSRKELTKNNYDEQLESINNRQ